MFAADLTGRVGDLTHARAIFAESREERQMVMSSFTAVINHTAVNLVDLFARPQVEARDETDAEVTKRLQISVSEPGEGIASEERAPSDGAAIAGPVATEVAEVSAAGEVDRPFQHLCSHLTAPPLYSRLSE